MKGHMTRAGWRGSSAGHADEANRRMALLRRTGLFGSDMRGAEVTRAADIEHLEKSYRLVHDVFVAQGYIHPEETGIRIRPYEALPQTATFIAKVGGDVVGVTTVVMDSPEFGLPAGKAFPDEIDSLRTETSRLCEGTNWLVTESHRSSGVMTELMRCSFAHALAMDCTDYLGAVSPGHAKFYKLLGFEQVGGVRSYSKDIDDPVVLVRLDITAFRRRMENVALDDGSVESFIKSYYVENNPYHSSIGAWQAKSDRFFSDPVLLRDLFVDRSEFLPRCSAEIVHSIEELWGKHLMEQVLVRQPELAAAT